MSTLAAFASAALLTIAPQADPQTAPQAAPGDISSTQLEDIIVEARRIEEAARAYVEEVGEPPRGTRLARWHRPVCVSMTNMQPRFAQFVIDRIAVNALNAGLEVGEPGCRPNVVILATTDGPALARRLVGEAGMGFRPSISGTNLSRDALGDFQNSDAPVRWWNVVMPVSTNTGQIAIPLKGDFVFEADVPRVYEVRDASRLRSNVRYEMAWTIVIIDMSRTGDAPLGVLADYLSMVSLAQIDASADLSGQSTIMNLFRSPGAIDGLSEWDKDYLTALYEGPANRATAAQQETLVVRSVVRQRREDERRDEAPVAGGSAAD